MKSKFKVGDYVNFEELTGEIVEVNKYDYESSFYYKFSLKYHLAYKLQKLRFLLLYQEYT